MRQWLQAISPQMRGLHSGGLRPADQLRFQFRELLLESAPSFLSFASFMNASANDPRA